LAYDTESLSSFVVSVTKRDNQSIGAKVSITNLGVLIDILQPGELLDNTQQFQPQDRSWRVGLMSNGFK
jgi:hypothetical protein